MIQQGLIASYPGTVARTYATWNPSDKNAGITLSNGNLTAVGSGGWKAFRGNIGKTSGKWYWEVKVTGIAGGNDIIGIGNSSATLNNYVGFDANGWGLYQDSKVHSNSFGSGYLPGSLATNNIIGVALDMDNGTVAFARNNTWGATAYTGITGTIYAMDSIFTDTQIANFGATTMTYSPPSGFNAGLYN